MRGAARSCPFSVNVPYELLEVVADAKRLEVLGFALPELARNVALQEDRYRRHSVRLAAMVDRFNAVLACMTEPEVSTGVARNVALQEDRYRRHSVRLAAMVDRFNAVLACMTEPEVRTGGEQWRRI